MDGVDYKELSKELALENETLRRRLSRAEGVLIDWRDKPGNDRDSHWWVQWIAKLEAAVPRGK
jgi:hypothetical protein